MSKTLEERQLDLFEQFDESSRMIHEMAEHPELATELEADEYVEKIKELANGKE